MDSTSVSLMAAIAILIMMSAYFSATETAFSSLNKIKLKNAMNNGNKRAALAYRYAEEYDRLLSTILIGNNIVNISSASIATVLFTKYWGNAGVTISTVVMTILVLIFGEISPKSLAKEVPEKFAIFSAPILRVFMMILNPINFIFMKWKLLLTKIFKIKGDHSITEEELITIVHEAQSEGGIDAHEGKLIRSAIEFNDLDVEDIITPRVNIIGVEEHATMEEVREVFQSHGFSRLIVYHETMDSVLGAIHEKDFYQSYYAGDTELEPIIHQVVCAPPQMKISALLRQLQQSKLHMAVVVDEFGGTIGIVTLEDILEELVGEIFDEHDEVVEAFRKVNENTYLISYRADLEEMFALFQLHRDKEEFDFNTVSGWVVQELGKIPEAGESFCYENLKVTVTKTDYRRVLEIQVEVGEKQEENSLAS